MAAQRSSKKEPVWISNNYSRQLAHKLRTTEQAILVGTNTVTLDNPSLTARDWAGNNPWRVVLDRYLKLPKEVSILDEKAQTIILTEKEKINKSNLFYEKIDFSERLAPQVCDILYRYEIQSLIIEGGMKTLQTFIDEQYWDEAMVFKGSTNFKNGILAPTFKGNTFSKKSIKTDTLEQFKTTTIDLLNTERLIIGNHFCCFQNFQQIQRQHFSCYCSKLFSCLRKWSNGI